MTEMKIWTARQTVRVAAPPKRVYELIADVDGWPSVFASVTTVERLGFAGACERVRVVEDDGHAWLSVRETNAKRLQVRFRHLDVPAPYASVGGLWLVVPKAAGAVVALDHYYRVVDDSPVTAARMARELAASGTRMLGTLRRTAEFGGVAELIASCSDGVAPEREAS